MKVNALSTARRYVANRDIGRNLSEQVQIEFDTSLCIAIADWFDVVADSVGTNEEQYQYKVFKEETVQQFEAVRDAGIEVLPWLKEGQPYANSKQLCDEVTTTGRLYVYLTSRGHGQCGSPHNATEHPMVEPSRYELGGVRFAYNDLFRVVHDFFGHVAHGNSFAARGEFLASWDHCQMYPEECHQVLLAETVGQICWFYYGPHLRDPEGQVPGPDSPHYIAPRDRPYSPQKTTPLPQEFVDAFMSLFNKVN